MSNEITILKCPSCGAGLPHINEELVKCCYCGNICMIQFEKKKKHVTLSFNPGWNYTFNAACSAIPY